MEDPHQTQPKFGDNVRDELIFFDWACNATKYAGNSVDVGGKQLGSSLVVVDKNTVVVDWNAVAICRDSSRC